MSFDFLGGERSMWGFIFGAKGCVARVRTVAPKNTTKSRAGLAAHYILVSP